MLFSDGGGRVPSWLAGLFARGAAARAGGAALCCCAREALGYWRRGVAF